MKKLIKIFIFNIAILGGTLFAQTVSPCSVTTPTCQRFVNQDIDFLNRSILAAANTGTTTTSTSSISVTNSIIAAATAGTISAGAVKLEFLTNAAFTGSINGISWDANLYVPFGNYQARTLPAITYTVSTGSLTILQTR